MPAASTQLHRTRPAGPTNGRPCLSSWSPGCSPTNTIGAELGPAPNTACVVSVESGHPLQVCTARSNVGSDFEAGTKGTAVHGTSGTPGQCPPDGAVNQSGDVTFVGGRRRLGTTEQCRQARN